MERVCSFWTASARVSVALVVGRRMFGGRRCRQREKSGDGKTVSALTRMLVMVSSLVK